MVYIKGTVNSGSAFRTMIWRANEPQERECNMPYIDFVSDLHKVTKLDYIGRVSDVWIRESDCYPESSKCGEK